MAANRPSEFQQKNPVRLTTSRSRFLMEPRWTGTFKSYELVPVFTYTDVLPGDTFKLSTSFVVRMSTPICPVMDDLFMDVAFYFIPHELILSRAYMSPSTSDSNHSWKAFMGAQDSFLNMPLPDNSIQLPSMFISYSSYVVGGIADCMGIPKPPSGHDYKVNPLAALAFMAVWNENYREPNTQNPGVYSISSGQVFLNWPAAGLIGGSNQFAAADLPNVCRFHGFFGSCLPWPQRNNTSVLLPLGTSAPLYADGTTMHSLGGSDLMFGLSDNLYTTGSYHMDFSGTNGSASGKPTLDAAESAFSETYPRTVRSTNLMVDLANASAVSINTFRLAVQEQRWFEALARGGNRIDELTESLFGVIPHDAGGNQPEYLGGKRIPIQVSQVNVTANSASGSHNNGVGETGAFSLTADSDYYFTKSFDKWGSIIGVACVRYRDSFASMVNPQFLRHERLDWYFPVFANLGEFGVKKHVLSILENTANNDWPDSGVFGYQEAWADFRTIPDVVTGLTRPGQSLAHWTYANDFTASTGSAVANLSDFLAGVNAYKGVDRTLNVGSGTSGLQFLAQFQYSIVAVRSMPTYSIPGLVDHH